MKNLLLTILLAIASSSYDFNLTPQLLTDGIIESAGPAYVELVTSEGVVPKGEREFTFDFDPHSRNKINSGSGWLEYRFHGYDFAPDSAEVTYQEALKGGRGGERVTVRVPVKYVAATGGYRINLEFPRKAGWRVQEVLFFRNGVALGDILPSRHFSSSWMSAGCGDEWVELDLGRAEKVGSVKIHWINKAAVSYLETSCDGVHWRKAGEVSGSASKDVIQIGRKCRYLRLDMSGGTADDRPYCITEIEVFAPDGNRIVCNAKPARDGWALQRASQVMAGGEQLSVAGFDSGSWVPATVPGTNLVSYINAGLVPDPDYGDNVREISESFFAGDFWYRKEFDYAVAPGKRVWLNIDGINWKAQVWMNGQWLGDINGAFIRGKFDVTSILKQGRNALAVKVIYNANPGAVKEKNARWTGYNGGILGADSPTYLASIGWDWMTTVRGRNCGIWNDVYLVETGDVQIKDPLVMSEISSDGRASMKVSVKVCGEFDKASDVSVEGWIGDIRFGRKVSSAGDVVFSPEDFPQLRDREMKLWWPNGYGEPALYDAGFVVKVNGAVSDSLHFKAGIRQVKTTEDDGILRLFVNGRRIMPVGGNWGFCQQNLQYSERDYDIAVGYHRQMNFNMIRNWVGQIEDEEFFAACDRYGILVWQDFPLANPLDGANPDDEEMFIANALDNTSRIRRHPCIALYCGRNEGYAPATLERAMRDDVVGVLHPDIPYLSSSADGPVSGRGPYNAQSAEYYFSHQSGKLHSERGMPTVLNMESLRMFMPQDDLWPIGDMWGKHDFTMDGPQRGRSYLKMLAEAFGDCTSAEEFTSLSQWINYDGYRAMFEAANAGGRMGLLLWMSHSCWPSIMWCTYDYYFQPTGAFFGSKKACEPLHIQYNALTKGVEVVNVGCVDHNGLSASWSIFGLRGNLLGSNKFSLDSKADSCVTVPGKINVPEGEQLMYLKLELRDSAGKVLSDNFYMIGAEAGNLRAVRTLPAAKLQKKVRVNGCHAIVTLKNKDKVPALLVRLILKDVHGGEVLPVDYSDNYFALMPGEEKTVDINWRSDSATEAVSVDLTQLGDWQHKDAKKRSASAVASLAAKQCVLMERQLTDTSIPKSFENGRFIPGSLNEWVSGFFPGTCWYTYKLTGDKAVKDVAVRQTAKLLDPASIMAEHDVGFQVMCSSSLAWKETGDSLYLDVIRKGAELLAGRFSPVTGVIRSWDGMTYPVIIDNMMNLELLTYASRLFGRQDWMDIAVSHARTTMKNHFREDYSSYHLVDYNPVDGSIVKKMTVQGYADDSAWSRGQSWGLYGFTMMYRETGLEEFLDQAEHIAGYLLPLLARRPVPAWDFNADESSIGVDDASAAAVMASAFVELSTLTKDSAASKAYLAQAKKIIGALSSPEYLAEAGGSGCFLIKHCTGFYKKNSQVDVPLSYADYYFMEALWRLKNLSKYGLK